MAGELGGTRQASEGATSAAELRYCAAPPRVPLALPPGLDPVRARAIVLGRAMWANGTVLHYYFFDRDGASDGAWVGEPAQQDAVRAGFQAWKELGIGLEFREVADRSEAEVRIGFMDGDGSWSYLGRDVLRQGSNARTMNFGWDLTTAHGRTTALHEIGHTLGMPHEHQNPFAGIVWDEAKVFEFLGGPPNNWDRDKTFHNVLRKLDPGEVEGSTWDPDSVMEYRFPGGLIVEPERYRGGIAPPGTVSGLDREFVRRWYPPAATAPAGPPVLEPFVSVPLELVASGQADFTLSPPGTREYQVGSFGASDVVLVLFEEVDGELRFVAGDDDAGEDRNALLTAKLFQGRRYVVRLRLYHAWESGRSAVMYW
jgi:hypothetical protein